MFLFANRSVSKIVVLTSVLFCFCDCGDWDDIFVYENVTIYPWHKNWTLITTTAATAASTTTTTTAATTEAPTTEQPQTTVNMNHHMYGKRDENARSFEFLLPRTLKIGDSLKVSGLLRDNPRTVSLSLVTGSNGGIDYSNVALEFTATVVEGEHDTYNISTILDNTREVSFEETPGGKLFFDSKFNFDVTINVDSESEERFLFDFFSNDSGLMQNIETKHHLSDVRYLILTGGYEKVEKLQFDFA